MSAPRIPRPLIARRMVLGGGIAAFTLAASAPTIWASEGGEAGEAGTLAALPDAVAFLTLVGLFEAQHRIVAGLFDAGDVAMAQEHLAASHHASYDDLEAGIDVLDVPGFEPDVLAFATLVNDGADAAEVQTAADAVYAGLAAVRAKASDKDQMKACEALLRVAASDMEAGVTDGQVTLAQEYRDSWGFATVAQLWLQGLAADSDAAVAGAATSALKSAIDVDAQYAGIAATAAPGDPGALLAAAARVELAAFQLK